MNFLIFILFFGPFSALQSLAMAQAMSTFCAFLPFGQAGIKTKVLPASGWNFSKISENSNVMGITT